MWTYANAVNADNTGFVPGVIPVATMVAAFATAWLIRERQEAWAFVSTGLTIVGIVATMFLNLYPRVMPSSISSAYDLTIYNASSTTMTLRLMTIVALIFVPIVLAYQAWTYWVFRRRLGSEDFSEPVNPLDVLASTLSRTPDRGDGKGGDGKGADSTTGPTEAGEPSDGGAGTAP